ncbi:MAG: flagellar filament capping protein FliD [Bryobacteraceae bacterium]
MSSSSVSSLTSPTSSLDITTPQTSTTDTSSFSTDLQSSVTRALDIASLPMQLLQQDQTQVNNQTSELSTLGTLFSGLQSALSSISAGTGSSALAATVSDQSVLTANLTGGALAGTYSVDVLNAGSSSSAISAAQQTPVTDPTSQDISSSSSFTLSVGATNYTIQPASQTLDSLASAINASGAPVQAVIVNLGSPSTPDYRLVVQSTGLGTQTLQLNDGTNNLLSSLNGGENASYTVNGQPPGGISTDSSTVTIAPGLNVTLDNTGATNITVAASLSTVSNALSSFVSAYNSAVAEVQKNFGQNGGALTGDSSILSMEQALDQLGSYTGSGGAITSLSQLGVEFTAQGTLTFDPTAVAGLSQSQISDALTFLGGTSTGGFLQYATNTLNSITDPAIGVIATETQSLQNESQSDQNQINTDQDQLNVLQQNLQAQMAQSNALIATLQQQNTFLQGLFQAETSDNPDASTVG